MEWEQKLTERELKELQFARLYKSQFSHGTDGHNRLLLIAKLSEMLDQAYTVKNTAEE